MATQQSVSEDDCVISEFFPSLSERTPAHLYKVQLSEAADLYHRLGSSPTQMRILDAVSLSPLVPTLHPASDTPEVSARLAPGSYYVFIALTGGSQATYALDLRRLECRVQAITLNTQVQSNLRENTCASGVDLVRKFGFTLSLRHSFDFQVIQTTEKVGLLLHSDSSVVGSTPKSNASGALKGILDPGRYVIEVYSPAGHISDFALRTSACPIGSLALNGVWQLEYASSLQGAACVGRTARQFYISIPSPRTIDVELRASNADFVAQLLTSDLLPFGPATPSGKAINLTRGVGGGTYILEIRSSGPFTGTYRIRGSLR
jgi:hypothetical protein